MAREELEVNYGKYLRAIPQTPNKADDAKQATHTGASQRYV